MTEPRTPTEPRKPHQPRGTIERAYARECEIRRLMQPGWR